MSVRKIDGVWYVDVRWRGHRYRKKSPSNDQTSARTYELRIRQQLETSGFIPSTESSNHLISISDETLAAFAREWFSTYVRTTLRASTRHGYEVALRLHILPELGRLPIRAITPREVEAFKVAKRGSGMHPKTLNGCLSVLRSCLTFAMDCGRIDVIPRIRWLKVPPSPFDHLSPSESRRLLAATAEQPYQLMIHTALRTGMRLGELLALRWECIDFEQRLIGVRTSRTRGEGDEVSENAPKNNRFRHIPIATDLLGRLAQQRRDQGYVFADFFGRPLSHHSARKALYRAARAAGLRRIGWHALRHTFATQLTSHGAPLHGVQAFMGHATMQMTLRYSHFAPTAFRNSVDLLEEGEKRALVVGSGLGSVLGSGLGRGSHPRGAAPIMSSNE